ncbi:acetylglutamate kinase [Woeseiaceae bacterium]|jgi:acetylglutamate kinase|nr:acetylglutamate kinase [Woeseiaceae bacterium]MDB2543773.1 acetylglutamate kinase [Woeseiaceae bacterium]
MLKNKSSIVSALKYAAPYIRLFKNKIFVIKVGGELFTDKVLTRKLIEQIAILQQLGIRIILIHGGGIQSTQMASSLGIEAQFVEGRRITDAKSIEIATMVLNGKINTQILAVAREFDLNAIGMSGIDAGLINAHRREALKTKDNKLIDYGFVGDIDSINTDLLEKQLNANLIPVISPLTCDKNGVILNINADTVAASIAAAIGAEKLILISSAPGILEDRDDNASLISYLDLEKLKKLIDEQKITDGMLPKSTAINYALERGVARVHIISYNTPDSLLIEIFTNDGTGTLVVNNIEMLSSSEQLGGML